MKDENKKIQYNETKVCKECGRELPIADFKSVWGKHWTRMCKKCIRKAEDKKLYQKALQQYLADDSMHFKRLYKEIDSSRFLRKKYSEIDCISRNERFVKQLYYRDTWISNFGRCIVLEDGKYELLKGSREQKTGKIYYSLEKECYIKSTKSFKYRRTKVYAESLVVDTFIVNYDKVNNTKIWHQMNDEKDLYYKNLYPVTGKQYERLTELQEKCTYPLSEEVIMDVVNAVEYKQDGWNPSYYKRGLFGVGYSGMKISADGCYEKSYTKWKNMIQRCYDKNVHKKYKPEYADKFVCEEWKNYANFKLWYDEHHVYGHQIDLDKDLLKQGNKEYSPENCVLIEHYINTIFENHAKDRIHENEEGMFVIANCKNKAYSTYEEALNVVCEKKQDRIEKVAEKNLGKIPMCAYDAMLKWNVREMEYLKEPVAMCG